MTRLGLDGLHVGVGAVRRGRLVLGLLVLHGVDDLVVGRRDGRARDGADDEDPARIYDVGGAGTKEPSSMVPTAELAPLEPSKGFVDENGVA